MHYLLAATVLCGMLSVMPAHAEVPLIGGQRAAFKNYGPGHTRNQASIRFLNDPAIGVGPSTDPRCGRGHESSISISSSEQDIGPIVLPCANWSLTQTGFRYQDTDALQGGVKTIRYRSGMLKIVMKGPNLTPLAGPVSEVLARFRVGETSYCGSFETFRTNSASVVIASGPSLPCETAPVVTPTPPPPVACGDGVVQGTEQCDDGNNDGGDCCASTCVFELTGSPCAGDGNPCTADRCDGAGSCLHESSDAACDDGNLCTTNDHCSAGTCTGGESVVPWINEFSYDSYTWGDATMQWDQEEFVEIAAAAGQDLGGYQLLAIEGGNSALLCGTGNAARGDAYYTWTLPAGSIVEDEAGKGIGLFVVCFSETSGVHVRASECDFVAPAPVPLLERSALKNGHLTGVNDNCSDGILLLDPEGRFVDAVSYEGAIPSVGDYGAFFSGVESSGRDPGDPLAPRQSLEKISSIPGRATSSLDWQLTGSSSDSPGSSNNTQDLTCYPDPAECGNGLVEFGEDCEQDSHCTSGWHCAGCWCEPAEGATYTRTRYPIVLAHGFLGFDKILGLMEYWPGIPAALGAGGAQVFVTQVSQINSSEVRGEQLIDQLEQIVAITGKPKVNLIGHSQGGLDIRYVASVRPDLVASLTTVASPHEGAGVGAILDPSSPEAELFSAIIAALGDLIKLLSGGEYPNDLEGAFEAFSPEGIAAFNAAHPNGLPTDDCGEGPGEVNGIRFYSWSGTAVVTTVIDPTDLLFALTAQMTGGENDGLVERCGSHFGKVLRDNYHHNHLDEVNALFGLVPLFEQNPKAIFRTHANRLKNAGR